MKGLVGDPLLVGGLGPGPPAPPPLNPALSLAICVVAGSQRQNYTFRILGISKIREF